MHSLTKGAARVKTKMDSYKMDPVTVKKMHTFPLPILLWIDLPFLRTYGSEQCLLRLLQSGPPI